MRSRRSVAALALALARLAREPTTRSRLWAMAAQASQAALAGNEPDMAGAPGPAGQVREHLFDLGVAAVLFLGLDGLERGIGEDGVVAPDGKQFALAVSGLAVEVLDPADDQPGGDRLPFLRGEGGVLRLGHLRQETTHAHAAATGVTRQGALAQSKTRPRSVHAETATTAARQHNCALSAPPAAPRPPQRPQPSATAPGRRQEEGTQFPRPTAAPRSGA